MDSSKEFVGKSYRSDYLHYNSEKFWEIRSFNNNKTLIRCGRLESDRKEDFTTIQAMEKAYNSTDEQKQAVKKLIDTKISKGYKYFEDNRMKAMDDSKNKVYSIISENKGEGSLKRGPPEMLGGDTITKQVKLDPFKKGSSEQRKEDSEFVNQEFILSRSQREYTKTIEKKLKEEGLFHELRDNKLYVLGSQKALAKIKDFLKDLELNSVPIDPKPEEIEMGIDPRIMKDVQRKGEELGIIAVYSRTKVVIYGPMGEKTDQFLSYIEKKSEQIDDDNGDHDDWPRIEESKGSHGHKKIERKSVYPESWDFSEKSSFCKVRLNKDSREFREVFDRLRREVPEVEISNIFKIHNALFMSEHIDYIIKKMESKPREKLERQLMWQYLDIKEVDPSHPSYDFSSVPQQGRFVLADNASTILSESAEFVYLSDVFLGKLAEKNKNVYLPPGFDSVQNGQYHITYDSLQSYPLYEIHYHV